MEQCFFVFFTMSQNQDKVPIAEERTDSFRDLIKVFNTDPNDVL